MDFHRSGLDLVGIHGLSWIRAGFRWESMDPHGSRPDFLGIPWDLVRGSPGRVRGSGEDPDGTPWVFMFSSGIDTRNTVVNYSRDQHIFRPNNSLHTKCVTYIFI